MLNYHLQSTDWGFFGLVAGERGLLATYLPNSRRQAIQTRIDQDWPDATPGSEGLDDIGSQIEAYFRGAPVRFDVTLDLRDLTPFLRSVARSCRAIPYGQTITYAQLADSADRPGASRAVGGAMARNRLPLIIPCHRVVRSDGHLGGFSAPDGIPQKRRLLALEGVHLARTKSLETLVVS